MSRYAQLAPSAFRNIQMNAGILCTSFTPSTGAVSGIIGVTSGGISFAHTTSWKDFGEDMDNCPKNTFQLKRKDSDEIKISGTFATVSTALAKMLIGAADVDSIDTTKVTPRIDPIAADFADLWFVTDYSDDISDSTGGHFAIHMKKALSSGGFQIQRTERDKGKFSFEFTAHFDYNAPTTIPYEIYIKEGTALGVVTVSSVAGTTASYSAITVSGYVPASGESYVYKIDTTVSLPSRGDSVASGWTAWNGVAEIEGSTGKEIAIVVKDSNNKAIAGGKTVMTCHA